MTMTIDRARFVAELGALSLALTGCPSRPSAQARPEAESAPKPAARGAEDGAGRAPSDADGARVPGGGAAGPRTGGPRAEPLEDGQGLGDPEDEG